MPSSPSAPSGIRPLGFYRFMRENAKLERESKAPAGAKRILLGITKASLSADSFISAASPCQPADGQTHCWIRVSPASLDRL